MVETTSPKQEGTLEEVFLRFEKRVVGYEDFIDCEQDHFKETLEGFSTLVERIQKESVFSSNEELRDVPTEHLKLLMIPYYQADVLLRIMENRDVNVKLGHTYYLEYLKLMNHYNLLTKGQVQQWKAMHKEFAGKTGSQDDMEDAPRDVKAHAEAFQKQNEDRETKIAAYRAKKAIEANLDKLKNYSDEQMKREFYKTQIEYSILNTFEALKMSALELDMLKYKATLTPDQIASDEAKSMDMALKPLKIQHIDVSISLFFARSGNPSNLRFLEYGHHLPAPHGLACRS